LRQQVSIVDRDPARPILGCPAFVKVFHIPAIR
jgi:hypothetical protein